MKRYMCAQSFVIIFLTLLSCALTLGYFSAKEDLLRHKIKMAKEDEYSTRQKSAVRNNFIISYQEWKELIEKPDSEQSRLVRIRAQLICKATEDSVPYLLLRESLTEEENKAHDAFWSHFSLDIKKLAKKCEGQDGMFICYVFPVVLEMQLELDTVYQRFFSFENLSAGEKFVIFKHFNYQLKYLAEGKEMPKHLLKFSMKLEAGKNK